MSALRVEVPLPPRRLRMGGEHFRADEDLVAAAVADVEKLRALAGLTRASRLLDWGCGAGRLAIGVKHALGHVRDYHGIDVQAPMIRWARRHLADEHTRFTLADAHNARYNPDGVPAYRIPRRSGTVDVFHAYSVFSHMTGEEVAAYAAEVRRGLAPGGRAWLTAFVEDGVPDEVENPAGYGPLEWSGPLHCVRFSRERFEHLLAGAGLEVVDVVHGGETDGQSAYVLRAR